MRSKVYKYYARDLRNAGENICACVFQTRLMLWIEQPPQNSDNLLKVGGCISCLPSKRIFL